MPDADQKLSSICQKELLERFGDNPPEAVKDRLAHELYAKALSAVFRYSENQGRMRARQSGSCLLEGVLLIWQISKKS